MNGQGSIELQGMAEVKRALAQADENIVAAAMKGLETAAMNIVNEAKMNLRSNGSVVTGLLRQSGHVERKGDEVTAGFFDTSNRNSGYALYVEFGRRAGKMPPPDEMAAFAYKKFHLKDWKLARSMGWAMARKVAEQGTQPHPFFVPAVNKNTKGAGLGGVVNSVTEAVRKAIRRGTASFAETGSSIRNTPAQ